MSLTVDRIDKIEVQIHQGQPLNVAVLRFKEPIYVYEFANQHDAFFAYNDQDGVPRIAYPQRSSITFKGFFLVPERTFGFQHSSIFTGSRTIDVRSTIDRFNFIGVLDCQELMRMLFMNNSRIKDWVRDPVNIATTYLLTVKGATVEIVEQFLKAYPIDFATLSSSFDFFELPMPDVSDPDVIDDALQLLQKD